MSINPVRAGLGARDPETVVLDATLGGKVLPARPARTAEFELPVQAASSVPAASSVVPTPVQRRVRTLVMAPVSQVGVDVSGEPFRRSEPRQPRQALSRFRSTVVVLDHTSSLTPAPFVLAKMDDPSQPIAERDSWGSEPLGRAGLADDPTG